SRRRHPRFSRDWSSDVCSSDLGGDRIEAYRASARSIAAYNKASEEDLERGMKQGELHVQFQPIMDIQSGQIAGAEALMRWNHPRSEERRVGKEGRTRRARDR